MILKLNPQFTIRNEDNCSYLIKRNGTISSLVDKDTQSVTIIPPVIGYILERIGKTDYAKSVEDLSSELCISKEVLDTFLQGLSTDSSKQIKFQGNSIVFPKYLVIHSDTPSINTGKISENFKSIELVFERPRVPIDVNIMVTTKCTTNCCYCYAKRKFDYELSSTEIINIIENCYNLGVVNLNLTGGDIFARKDWKEILFTARKFGYNPFISTKTPLPESDVNYLNSIGITEIQFSLDTCKKDILQELIGVQADYIEQVARMFQCCQTYHIKLCIRTVLCKQNANVHCVSELFHFISKYDCIKDWVLTPAFFSEFKQMYQQYEVSNDKLIAVRDYVTKLDKIFPVYLSKITSCGYKLKQYPTVDEYVSYNQKCYANSYSMSILASGECTICEMLYDNRDYLIGNIRNQTLAEVWNSERALLLYAPMQPSISEASPCHSCTVFDKCRKSISKRVCYVDIAKTNKLNTLNFPDPRCPMANEVSVVL